ncbi:hypothetical protein KJ742_04725 [Patescibacteria group bacterium]|nr:hypothetical protein [Patescibacteria group bacterium]MBU1683223.1 hypothetical protein [Patescibacteria group bacterium]MBU1935750.1 hypothetical protein [Patescibacteria group bacterium]
MTTRTDDMEGKMREVSELESQTAEKIAQSNSAKEITDLLVEFRRQIHKIYEINGFNFVVHDPKVELARLAGQGIKSIRDLAIKRIKELASEDAGGQIDFKEIERTDVLQTLGIKFAIETRREGSGSLVVIEDMSQPKGIIMRSHMQKGIVGDRRRLKLVLEHVTGEWEKIDIDQSGTVPPDKLLAVKSFGVIAEQQDKKSE